MSCIYVRYKNLSRYKNLILSELFYQRNIEFAIV